ncbi:MAG: GNAT family N-acetyltransferase [Eubacteriales bacterium]|nr:GNAT family N-acetyltransferase [Eubacteriales bacterium]
MSGIEIIRIDQQPQLLERAAAWFHAKWGIPLAAYEQSMQDSLAGGPVPMWFAAMDGDEFVGGLGVIENDFHARKDLAPNVCAVYVEEAYRRRGIAGALLARVSAEMAAQGVDTLYLVTSHVGFYERYGWSYFCPVLCDGEAEPSRMYRHIAK